MKTEAEYFYETLVNLDQTTRRHTLQDRIFQEKRLLIWAQKEIASS
jgi:hypothetical protein